MATKARFLKAADNSRPFKAHRYDVFGLKVDRSITLFGCNPLNTWVLLEADSTVVSYCERPLVIPDVKPKRVVDFWVNFLDREELWILQRQGEFGEDDYPASAMPAFLAWASSHGMAVRFMRPVEPTERITYLDNWGRILRDLSANRRFVSPAMVERVRSCVMAPRPISTLPDLFPDDDPVLLRTAAFFLVHAGKLRCVNIEEVPLGPASIMEPA